MLTFYSLGLAFGLSASAENTLSIDPGSEAIDCAAAIEVMSRIAPQWAQQADIVRARKFWDDQAIAINADDPNLTDTQITHSVTLHLQELETNPSAFARKAANCSEFASIPNVSG